MDQTPPAAPTNLVCTPGGGSGEFGLEWDAPADPADVAGVKVYLSESGGQFNRIRKLPMSDGQIDTSLAGGTRWEVVVFPMPEAVPIDLAVSVYDSAGNESGWDTIDAFFAGAIGPCYSGPPAAPTDFTIDNGGGSGEIVLVINSPIGDVASYSMSVDQGSGVQELTSSGMQYIPSTGHTQVVFMWVDWSLPGTYRIFATDAHGNDSPVVERSCPPLPGISDSC